MDIKTYNKFILIGSRCGNVNSQVRKYIEDNSLSNYVVKMIINPPKKYNDMMDILNGCEYVAHTSKIINQDNIYGVQFHPELQARPLQPHPIFTAFVKAAYESK